MTPKHTASICNGARASFWSPLIRTAAGPSGRAQWDRLTDLIQSSDSLTLYNAIEEGVPSWTVSLLSSVLSRPEPTLLATFGLTLRSHRRALEAGTCLPDQAACRVVALMRVAARFRQIVEESSERDLAATFDLPLWLGVWISAPLPELQGRTPEAMLRNPEGHRVLDSLIDKYRAGVVA